MTDKEQIIIDGCNVGGCKYLNTFSDSDGYHYYCDLADDIKNEYCEHYRDCYFKQLARKTRECEELFAKTYQMWMYYIANGINNASDLNIQHLLEDLGKITKMLAELCNIKDSTLSYYAGQALDETNRYRKALEEIEELVKSLNENRMCFYDDVNDCSNCDMNTDCNYLRKFKILDIINKAKNEVK